MKLQRLLSLVRQALDTYGMIEIVFFELSQMEIYRAGQKRLISGRLKLPDRRNFQNCSESWSLPARCFLYFLYQKHCRGRLN